MLEHTEAQSILREIKSTEVGELRDSFYRTACRYAELRAAWALTNTAGRASLDGNRTRAHNAFIDAVNILSRTMAANGDSIEWRRRLGDDRKRIGDLACYVHCVLGIAAR